MGKVGVHKPYPYPIGRGVVLQTLSLMKHRKWLDLDSLSKLTMSLVQIPLRSYKVGYPTEFAYMQNYILISYNQERSVMVGKVSINLENKGSNLSRDKKEKVSSRQPKSWIALFLFPDTYLVRSSRQLQTTVLGCLLWVRQNQQLRLKSSIFVYNNVPSENPVFLFKKIYFIGISNLFGTE